MSGDAHDTFVGVDIGGTSVRLAIVDAFGRVLSDRRAETPSEDNGDALVEWIGRALDQCLDETESYPRPLALGVAVPGILEPGRSAVVRAVNLPFIEGLPLRDRLVEMTGLVTLVDSDAVAAAWGEFSVRHAEPARFGYLTIGTGIGGAIILDRQVLRHTHHSAGHLGHLICETSPGAPLCRCGATGCLEALIAGPALNELAAGAGFTDLPEIELACQEDAAAARSFVERAAGYLSAGILSLVHLYAVQLLVIGGGVAAVLPSLIHRAGELACESPSTLLPRGFHVEFASLGDCTGVVGAALLARQHLQQKATPPT